MHLFLSFAHYASGAVMARKSKGNLGTGVLLIVAAFVLGNLWKSPGPLPTQHDAALRPNTEVIDQNPSQPRISDPAGVVPTGVARQMAPADSSAVEQLEAPLPTSAPVPNRVFITATSLNVRTAASKDSKAVGKLPYGQSVFVLQTKSGWALVETEAGLRGWASSDFMSNELPAQKPTVVRPPAQRAALNPAPKAAPKVDRSLIVQKIIQRSIFYYSGSCACPYNHDRGGRRCGARSAYSKPGGASPICFAGDVTEAMISNFRG